MGSSLNIRIFGVIPACRSVAYAHKPPGPNTHPLHLPMFQHGFLFLQRARVNIYAQNDELTNENFQGTCRERKRTTVGREKDNYGFRKFHLMIIFILLLQKHLNSCI